MFCAEKSVKMHLMLTGCYSDNYYKIILGLCCCINVLCRDVCKMLTGRYSDNYYEIILGYAAFYVLLREVCKMRTGCYSDNYYHICTD